MIKTIASGFIKNVGLISTFVGTFISFPVASHGINFSFLSVYEYQCEGQDNLPIRSAVTTDLADQDVQMICLKESSITIFPNTVVSIRENTVISTVQGTDWTGTEQIVYLQAEDEKDPVNTRPEQNHTAADDTIQQKKSIPKETEQLVEDQQRLIANLPIQAQREPLPFTQTIVPASGLMMQKTAKDHKYLLAVQIDPVPVSDIQSLFSYTPRAYSTNHLSQRHNKSPPSAK